MYFVCSEKDLSHKFSGLRLSVPIVRGFQMLTMENLITMTFYFGGLAGMNSGILASVFVMGAVFTIITFYCKFGQKISKWDAVGTFLVIACVSLIAYGSTIGII